MNQLTEMFDSHELTIVENGEEVLFLLKDVCSILEIGHAATVRKRLEYDVVSNHPIQDRLGRKQNATFINEDGLYDVILDSRKSEAKRFRKWVTNEVLPSVRKHGAYATPDTIENVLNDPDFGIQLLTNLKQEREEREKLERQREQDRPYTQFGKTISNSDGSITIGAFAKLLYDKHGVNIGRNKLFVWLRDNGYLIKSGRGKNEPMQRYLEQGLFEVKATLVSTPKGDVEKTTTLVTGKGQYRLAERLKEDAHEAV